MLSKWLSDFQRFLQNKRIEDSINNAQRTGFGWGGEEKCFTQREECGGTWEHHAGFKGVVPLVLLVVLEPLFFCFCDCWCGMGVH